MGDTVLLEDRCQDRLGDIVLERGVAEDTSGLTRRSKGLVPFDDAQGQVEWHAV